MREGEWEEVLPRVYRIGGTPPSWEQSLFAASLWGGRAAAISHRSAARLWGLDGVEGGPIEITVGRRLEAQDIVVHRSKLLRTHVTKIQRIRVTTPSRTLLDLGAVVSRAKVERALDYALHRRLTNLTKLSEVLEESGGPGRAGTATLRKLLAIRDTSAAPPESLLEARLGKALARSRLPAPISQFEIREGSRLLARVDFAWPDGLVALEADGYEHHGGHSAWKKDLARGNRLSARGWRVLHVTWEDVMQRPDEVIRSVAAALQA